MASKMRSWKQKFHEAKEKTCEQRTVSEQIIHGNRWIPEHVMDDILQKLPARSLLRFKCVCKSWNSTISEFLTKNPKLILLSKESLRIMNYEASTGEATKLSEKLRDDELEDDQYVKVWNSCNGLLLISKWSGFGADYEDLLWNPLTGERRLLTIRRYSFNFQLGFGYDYYNNDYKIAIFDSFPGNPRSHVYSFRKGSQRILYGIPQGRLFSLTHKPGMLVNKSELYWNATYHGNPLLIEEGSCIILCNEDNPDDRNPRHLVIFGFNLVSESPMLLRYPAPASDHHNQLMDYKGSLCVIQTEHDTNIQMWVLKGEMPKVNWVKLMSIPHLEELPSKKFLAVTISLKNDEALMAYGEKWHHCCGRFHGDQMQLYSYSLTEKAYRKVKVRGCKNWARALCFNLSMDSLTKWIEERDHSANQEHDEK